MKDINMEQHLNNKPGSRISGLIIKFLLGLICFIVFVSSRYGFLFFVSGVVPSLFVAFMDSKNDHRCASATVFSFNMMGIIPYMFKIWNNGNSDLIAREIISNIRVWFTVYFISLVGYLFYIIFPMLISKFYLLKLNMEKDKLIKKRIQIATDWDVEINDTEDKVNSMNTKI